MKNQDQNKEQKVLDQKARLEQKKNRLIIEETRLKLKERKARTRNLIELGGLIVKAKLDTLPINTLYGALLTLVETLEKDEAIRAAWVVKGNTEFNKEKQERIPVILKFDKQASAEVREFIRSRGLMWNRFRSEWYGTVVDLELLKEGLRDIQYNIEEL